MANTTNLSLGKLAGTEKLKTFPAVQAGNMDTIDAAFGAGFGISSAPSVNTSINNLADGLAIISNNNTHAAITSGQFVYVRNHGTLSEGLYQATSNISANGTLSGSNLTADTSGGLNAVKGEIPPVVNNLTSDSTTSALSAAQGKELNTKTNPVSLWNTLSLHSNLSLFAGGVYQMGRLIVIAVRLSVTGSISSATDLITGLPYTIGSTSSTFSSVVELLNNLASTRTIVTGNGKIQLIEGSLSNGNTIYLSGVYFTNA